MSPALAQTNFLMAYDHSTRRGLCGSRCQYVIEDEVKFLYFRGYSLPKMVHIFTQARHPRI